jgi:hypothetical protein
MFRRATCSLLIVLALWTSRVAAEAATSSGGAPAVGSTTKKITTGYTVFYRRPGATAWTQSKLYRTFEAASAAAQKLYQDGFETQVQARTALLKVPPQPKTLTLPDSQTVTMLQVKRIFRWMSGQGDIAFHYPADGCYARAHLMIRRMQKAGYTPFKVWTFQNGESLYVRTSHHPHGYVTWKYHVAPILRVRLPKGKQRWYVIDPSLFSRPVTVAQWRNIQKRPSAKYSPYLTLTRVGQAPLDIHRKRLPGSGYWPGHDPREGIDRHALSTMRRYKPWEGRIRPKDVASSDESGRTIRQTGLARIAESPAALPTR